MIKSQGRSACQNGLYHSQIKRQLNFVLRCEGFSESMRGIDSYTCPLHATAASPMMLAPRRSDVNTK